MRLPSQAMDSFNRSTKPVAIWLLVGVFMLIIQILLGGITRLTGSGLSITEWDVITGTLPPFNEQAWIAEFQKYRQTPQYRFLNTDFSLSDFKNIYFWEWLHRLWGRLIGIVFLIPFIVFIIQRRFEKNMIRPLIILFLLGALQGVIGWIMVASGLTGDAIYVKPTRLALHFIFAMLLLGYTFWLALKLIVDQKYFVPALSLRNFTWWIIGILAIQFIFGALMAGLKAAPSAPTWPDINGSFFPPVLFNKGLRSMIEDRIFIHFIHRMLAYLLLLLIIAWNIAALRKRGSQLFSIIKGLPLFFIIIQATLGVLTVLSSTAIRPGKWNLFEWMAELHQFVALLLLLSLVFAAFLLQKKSTYKETTHVDPHVI